MHGHLPPSRLVICPDRAREEDGRGGGGGKRGGVGGGGGIEPYIQHCIVTICTFVYLAWTAVYFRSAVWSFFFFNSLIRHQYYYNIFVHIQEGECVRAHQHHHHH